MQKIKIFVTPLVAKILAKYQADCKLNSSPYFDIENQLHALLLINRKNSEYDTFMKAYSERFTFEIDDAFYFKVKDNATPYVFAKIKKIVERYFFAQLQREIDAYIKYSHHFKALQVKSKTTVQKIKAKTIIKEYLDSFGIEEADIKLESVYKQYVRKKVKSQFSLSTFLPKNTKKIKAIGLSTYVPKSVSNYDRFKL
jgi:hypothetical protein